MEVGIGFIFLALDEGKIFEEHNYATAPSGSAPKEHYTLVQRKLNPETAEAKVATDGPWTFSCSFCLPCTPGPQSLWLGQALVQRGTLSRVWKGGLEC